MLPGRTYTVEDAARILRRRWWILLLPLALGTWAGVFLYQWLPPRYQSETLIMVVPQRIPDSFVKSTVTMNVEDRLRSISEQILSRSRLERIIQDLNLYEEQRRTGVMEDVVRRMRRDVELTVEGQESSFRISYSSPDPETAKTVTERLAALYIEENLRDRENLAESTSDFLESQLQEAKKRLIAQERKLEAYRRRYSGQLPSQLDGNLQALQSAQMQLQSLGESLNRAQERRFLVERQIADARSLPVDRSLTAVTGLSSEAASALSAAEQLEAARARLKALTVQYTRNHPDVLALEDTIRDLESKVKAAAQNAPDEVPATSLSPEALARRKRLGELQAELSIIDRQISAAQEERNRLKAAIADYRTKVEVVPTRESELVELTRDYGTLQEAYSSLLRKREESELAADLERRQIGEQFRILDPASLPERPHNQKHRLAVLAGGVLGGLGLGVLLIGLLEYRDSSFWSEDDVHRVLSLPALALVPVLEVEQGASRLSGPAKAWRMHTTRAADAIRGTVTSLADTARRLAGSSRTLSAEPPEQGRWWADAAYGAPAGDRAAPAYRPSISQKGISCGFWRSQLESDRTLVVGARTMPFAIEQYRRLVAALHDAQVERGLKTLMVTSAAPGEGKTLTVVNLALTLSESCRRRVLLIDADLRRPSVHGLLRLPNARGLSDVLRSERADIPLLEVSDHLSVLSAGRPDQPIAGLTSDRMRSLLERVVRTYDWVLLDAAPVGVVADAQLLARFTRAVLFVIAAHATPYSAVNRALAQLDPETVIGTVLNRVREHNIPAAGYYRDYCSQPRTIDFALEDAEIALETD